jgi:hypothetical protein
MPMRFVITIAKASSPAYAPAELLKGYFDLDIVSSLTEQIASEEANGPPRAPSSRAVVRGVFNDNEPADELGMWLSALRSFFHPSNHPFSEAEQAEILTRDWKMEMRITRQCLLRSIQLALSLVDIESPATTPVEGADETAALNSLSPANERREVYAGATNRALVALAEALNDVNTVCDALLDAPTLSFRAWASAGKIIAREIGNSEAARLLARTASHHASASLQAPLLALTRDTVKPDALGADMLIIFSDLARLLERLRFIEACLRSDSPLKQTLPIFTLVHEEARALLKFIETRALRTDDLEQTVFDALDSSNYAIAMELRKVFAHELVGLGAIRQAPAIYAKVENAHGLLRDCFQQSTVGLAQLFDPALDGARLFNAFQTKLEQSLALRRDVWTLLQLVRRAEKERDRYPIAHLLERLASFRDGSLRYLMYKDWEACERFIEEVAAARGAIELAPVLHRFGTYLETLHGQVNMRAVLANHPFDYPALES